MDRSSARLEGLARQLRDAPKTWRLESARLLRDTAHDEAAPALHAAALAQLPKRGGLDVWVADEKITVQAGLTAGSSYVRLRQPFRGAYQANKGYIRHPVFADGTKTRRDWRWVTQELPLARGWWAYTLRKIDPRVTKKLEQAVREMSDAIEARI